MQFPANPVERGACRLRAFRFLAPLFSIVFHGLFSYRHFRWDGAVLVGKTPIGRANVTVLAKSTTSAPFLLFRQI
jgi:hypothetical protein